MTRSGRLRPFLLVAARLNEGLGGAQVAGFAGEGVARLVHATAFEQ